MIEVVNFNQTKRDKLNEIRSSRSQQTTPNSSGSVKRKYGHWFKRQSGLRHSNGPRLISDQ